MDSALFLRGSPCGRKQKREHKKGRRSVDDYIEQTALANPHASIRFVTPKDEPRVYERVTKEPPKESIEIKPHPYGVELGILARMLKESKARNLRGALTGDFSRVSAAVAAAYRRSTR